MSDFEWSWPLLSVKKTKQFLRDFEGSKFKKFKQFEGSRMGQVDYESAVFYYIISIVSMPYIFIFWRVIC